MFFRPLSLWLLGALALVFLGATETRAGAAKPTVLFRIHLQSSGQGLSANQIIPVQVPPSGERIFVRTIPEVTEREIIAAELRPTGQGTGLYVKFNERGTLILDSITTQNQGLTFVIYFNNRILYAPIIDSRITNGELLIPREIAAEEITALQQLAQRQAKR
jgi:preprotein translocase subunit SecD